ncbi:MAG: hypothetical protein OXR84_06715, partial [Magnetovibrio sp.]|nr:hypothetical protein [Magnetovibrio sp.]
LETALAALDAEGIHLTVEAAGADKPATGPVIDLDLIGPDHPGILHEITHCLAERRISVEEMETEIRGAPVGGGNLFHARARVRLPDGTVEDDLRDALEDLAGTLMVDIALGDGAA